MMFAKGNNRLESLIGANATFKGDITVKGTLRIDGTVEGTITADFVILGEKSVVQGDITAKKITIGGKAEGHFIAKELLEITVNGMVLGDVSTGKLSIAEGGTYNGRIFMEKTESNVVGFHQKEAETDMSSHR